MQNVACKGSNTLNGDMGDRGRSQTRRGSLEIFELNLVSVGAWTKIRERKRCLDESRWERERGKFKFVKKFRRKK